jgi:hypothetical protein
MRGGTKYILYIIYYYIKVCAHLEQRIVELKPDVSRCDRIFLYCLKIDVLFVWKRKRRGVKGVGATGERPKDTHIKI